jgi:hypothetical protein
MNNDDQERTINITLAGEFTDPAPPPWPGGAGPNPPSMLFGWLAIAGAVSFLLLTLFLTLWISIALLPWMLAIAAAAYVAQLIQRWRRA